MSGEGRRWFPLIAERAGWLCERCGCAGQSVHHRKKRSQGGGWSWENLVFVCGTGTTGCHGWIEHNPNDAEWEGFHVRPWQQSAAIPVKYQGEWALLLPDGGIQYESGNIPRGDQVQAQGQASRALRQTARVRLYPARHPLFGRQPCTRVR